MYIDSTLPIECRFLPNVEALELIKFVLFGDGDEFHEIFKQIELNENNLDLLQHTKKFIQSLLDLYEDSSYSSKALQEIESSLRIQDAKRDSASSFPVNEGTIREIEAQLLLNSVRNIQKEHKGAVIARSIEACTNCSEVEVAKLTKIIQGDDDEL